MNILAKVHCNLCLRIFIVALCVISPPPPTIKTKFLPIRYRLKKLYTPTISHKTVLEKNELYHYINTNRRNTIKQILMKVDKTMFNIRSLYENCN